MEKIIILVVSKLAISDQPKNETFVLESFIQQQFFKKLTFLIEGNNFIILIFIF